MVLDYHTVSIAIDSNINIMLFVLSVGSIGSLWHVSTIDPAIFVKCLQWSPTAQLILLAGYVALCTWLGKTLSRLEYGV